MLFVVIVRMTDIEKLIKVGKDLSLSGGELKEWAETQLREQRDNEKTAYERMKEESENARKKLERERELIEQKRLMTEKELELLNLRRQTVDNESDISDVSTEQVGSQLLPRLPVFQESVDHISVYLNRFEKYVTINKFPKETHAMVLSTYLKGSALEVFHRLSKEESQNYDSLLKRYEITAEQSRRKFREITRNKQESFHQLMIRLESDLSNWVEMSGGSKKKPEDLWDMIMKEQFMANCSKELQTHILDREPKKCEDMAKIADRYVEARKTATDIAPKSVTVTDQQRLSSRPKGHLHKGLPNTKTCSYCKRPGHSFEKCYQRQWQNRK